MSNFFLADRVKETSRVQGTGSISLDGAAAGFSAFEDFYASGDLVFYAITDNVQYEIGSGVFKQDGSTQVITRNPFRSSNINVGPWYVNATSNSGPTNGNTGFFYPLWLSRSAAQSGIGFSTGPFPSVSGVTFNQYPGITFYYTSQHFASGVGALAGSGANYATSGQPVSFGVGVKEVFVTYPGKTAVYNGFGIEAGVKEPKDSGIAFWKNEQILNYTSNLVWNDTNGFLGVNKSNPSYAIDVGGLVANSIIRASGFIDGGSGVMFSGGQLTDTLLTASGGRQWEPFLRNRKGSAANGVIELSGIVDQIIDFADQPVATVFAGPISGVCNPCPDDAPSFRRLVASDLPTVTELQSLWSVVTQNNIGLDNETANISPNNFIQGMIPIYYSSGVITYDSGIFYDATNNRLLVGGNAATDTPSYTLDLRGDGTLSAATGTITTINSTSGNFSNLQAVSGNLTAFNYLSSASGYIATLSAISGTINNLFANSGNAMMLVVNSGDITTLSSISGNFNHVIFRDNLVRVGTGAANNASGMYNVYIGLNAGIAVSGHENIEIIASGSNTSLLTHEASGKINIGNTIVGDIYSARVTIGEPDDASPDATLHVRPRISTEPAFIIQHQNAGSTSVPYMQLQSGDGTTFYRVTNSGDVITSGYLNPSGGILLEPITPANWMNSTANRLYNDGGTLKFNGNTITVGGSYSFYLTDGKQASDQITDSQTVTVSGVSGVEVDYDPAGGGFIRISASGLSGVLQNQITAQTYKFYSAASGYGSNNNAPKEHLANSYLVVSGVSGVNIDHRNLTDGTNSSGIYIIGYDPTVAYSFNVTNGDVANDTITNTQTITVSGVSGIRAEYDPVNNFFRIGASGLSGVLNTTINNSGNFLLGQILQNTASGLAISGIAAFASGQIVGFTQQSAASGLKIQSNTYILDPNGSGSIRQLNFPSGSIIIDSFSLNESSPNFRNGHSGLGGPGSIFIGSGAGKISTHRDSGVIAIGTNSFTGSTSVPNGFRSYNICIGHNANGYYQFAGDINNLDCISIGRDSQCGKGKDQINIGQHAGKPDMSQLGNTDYAINIGYYAGSSGVNPGLRCLSIGRESNFRSSGNVDSIFIGGGAGYLTSGSNQDICIGNYASSRSFNSFACNVMGVSAAQFSYNNNRSNFLGYSAGYGSKYIQSSVNIGEAAGYNSSGNINSIFIGINAGYEASGSNNATYIGPAAGGSSHNNDYSIFIGYAAGYQAYGFKNSISIQKDAIYGEDRDFKWVQSPPGNLDYLDIGKCIQGTIDPPGPNLHIGKPLVNTNDWNANTYRNIYGIQDSTLTLTPKNQNQSALKLFFNTSDTAGSIALQNTPLFRTQFKSAGMNVAPYAALNTIIDQNGALNIPVARTLVGSAGSAELRTVDNHTIPRNPGAIAIYQLPTMTGIAICINPGNNALGIWHKIPITGTF